MFYPFTFLRHFEISGHAFASPSIVLHVSSIIWAPISSKAWRQSMRDIAGRRLWAPLFSYYFWSLSVLARRTIYFLHHLKSEMTDTTVLCFSLQLAPGFSWSCLLSRLSLYFRVQNSHCWDGLMLPGGQTIWFLPRCSYCWAGCFWLCKELRDFALLSTHKQVNSEWKNSCTKSSQPGKA